MATYVENAECQNAINISKFLLSISVLMLLQTSNKQITDPNQSADHTLSSTPWITHTASLCLSSLIWQDCSVWWLTHGGGRRREQGRRRDEFKETNQLPFWKPKIVTIFLAMIPAPLNPAPITTHWKA